MRIDVISIFAEAVQAFTTVSLVGKASDSGLLDLRFHDPREVTTDVHRTVDDAPFGGGAGMVLKPEPIFEVVERQQPPRPLIYLSPSGPPLTQAKAVELAKLPGFSLLCGRFEGVDERVREHLVDEELSIGDYVLAGGEVAAAVVIEAVTRLVPGVLGNTESVADESFSSGLLEYPQYTRPATFRQWEVPDVLRSGNHGLVERWRRAHSLHKTITVRPDLISGRGDLTEQEQALLAEFGLDSVLYSAPEDESSER